MATASRYEGWHGDIEVVVLPLRPTSYRAEVFGTELEMPRGPGIAIFAASKGAVMSCLIGVRPTASMMTGLAEKLAHGLNRGLHGVVAVPDALKRQPADWVAYEAGVAEFTRRVDESRARVDDWQRIIAPMLTDALAALGLDGEG